MCCGSSLWVRASLGESVPSIVWVLGMKLKWSGKCPITVQSHCLRHLAGPLPFLNIGTTASLPADLGLVERHCAHVIQPTHGFNIIRLKKKKRDSLPVGSSSLVSLF